MLSERALSLKPSPTLALAAQARELASQGFDVISLSVGEPDWDTFENVKRAGQRAIEEGQTKYGPSNGSPELRKAIASVEGKTLGVQYSPTQVTVSTGAKFVIFSALQMLLDPGDEVLIPAPYWVSYPTMVELAGGQPVIVPTNEESQFKLRPEHLKPYITPKTKLLLLNSPSNPTGAMMTREECAALGEFLKAHPHIFVMSDDIYNRLIFSGDEVAPHILHTHPELKDRMVVINGVSKSYSMTGWRVGWAMGPEALIAAMTNYQSQSVSCVSPFAQTATVEALTHSSEELKKSILELKARRDFMYKALNQIQGLSADCPEGAFYFWVNVRKLLGTKHGHDVLADDKAWAKALLAQEKVVVVPGGEFGIQGYVRMSYALNSTKMQEAMTRLARFGSGLRL